ncbi:nucleotidyltransferase [Siminovitchia sp. FSL H7-0308]|uniref:nucleotidyltransferase n=1 Tax=Siminovitchia sp. FSL H7-0308 TaxID=2921432 RepID=UPI0030EC3E9B
MKFHFISHQRLFQVIYSYDIVTGVDLMKSVGIIAEYNPFHNGHLYHLHKSKEVSGAGVVICVMSGNFLQRGEPALISKWYRTRMALEAGSDIVVELPYAFAVQKAEIFAFGAVYLLNALKCDSICFGSESGEVQPFFNTLDYLNKHSETYNDHIKRYVKQGVSYPRALALAYEAVKDGLRNGVDLSKPNNILGYQYIRAAHEINSHIHFFTVKRNKAGHHDQTFHHEKMASATSIRKSLSENPNLDHIAAYVPESTLSALASYVNRYKKLHDWEDYWPYLQYRLLTMSDDELQQVYDAEEGLPYRLKKTAQNAKSFHSFMESAKTKRYTWTRLQRICVHILTNTPKNMMIPAAKKPQYIRLLGMSSAGRDYLNKRKKELELPLISTVSSYPDEWLMLDRKSSQVYAHVLPDPEKSRLVSLEFAQPPIMIGNRP